MYPVIRFAREMLRAERLGPLEQGEVHRSTVICWPWDIDVQLEMNNGRVLTLFDTGRVAMFRRTGVIGRMRALGWYGTIAGSAIRYRRRITLFQRLEMRTRFIGVDERFLYIEQGLFRGGDCAAHAVLRAAITTGRGIIPTAEVLGRLGMERAGVPVPGWVAEWDAAERHRPWPPMDRTG